RDLPPFEAALRDEYAARATRPSHFNAGGAQVYEPRRDTAFGAASPNGNDVSLPEQLARATDAMATQDKAMTIYGKTLDILRLGLGRR
ncbi:MAG: flagellar basal body rod protein FlgB, partial [Alphaproteobacteria bacterium]|nr:flagellar basal body rod protein FlgB [Alphaproteobacteria bacterium]